MIEKIFAQTKSRSSYLGLKYDLENRNFKKQLREQYIQFLGENWWRSAHKKRSYLKKV